MVNKEFFKEKIRETAELLNQRLTKNFEETLYKRIFSGYIDSDLEQALNTYEADKLNYQFLLKELNRYRTLRFEEENRIVKEKEEAEFRQWWLRHQGSRQECINKVIIDGFPVHECYSCKRQYCDVIARDAIKHIKLLFSGKITKQQMNKELNKYRGIGWSVEEPF